MHCKGQIKIDTQIYKNRFWKGASMDIGYESPNMKFSLRSAALIFKNACILLVKSDCHTCFYTVGGGIRENETSERAIIRECYEETGYHFEIDRLVFIEERFFSVDSTYHREIVFFYLMKEADIQIASGASTDQNNEHLYWIPMERLKQIELVPEFLKSSLDNIPNEITHILSYE